MAAFDGLIDSNPQTLCDWVKNFRIKKVQMKRKLRVGGDLRVCAILSTALNSAEKELRRKQHERFNKWLEMQTKLSQYDNNRHNHNQYCNNNNLTKNKGVVNASNNNHYYSYNDVSHNQTNDEEINHHKEINKLWKCELSGLDEFMKNISSNNRNTCVQS